MVESGAVKMSNSTTFLLNKTLQNAWFYTVMAIRFFKNVVLMEVSKAFLTMKVSRGNKWHYMKNNEQSN